MNICFSLSNLESGGAQIFVLRLAHEIATRGHRVSIYDHQPELRNKHMLISMRNRVRICSYAENSLLRFVIWKINALLLKLRIHKGYRNALNKRAFRNFLRSEKISLLNSHMSLSDFVIADTDLPEGCHFVITLHGEYELLIAEHGSEYMDRISAAIGKAAALIYTAGKNFDAIASLHTKPAHIVKIPVGLASPDTQIKKITRKELGFSETDFIAGMVGRGIPEKGWDTAVQSVLKCRIEKGAQIVLLMVGDSDYLRELHTRTNDPAIKLATFRENYQDYFSCYDLMDILIFPTTFSGESMPNVVIEALSKNVPVVATRHAEIPQMLKADSPSPAGVCVCKEKNLTSAFSEEIFTLYSDREKLKELSANCAAASDSFRLHNIADTYISIFGNLRQPPLK